MKNQLSFNTKLLWKGYGIGVLCIILFFTLTSFGIFGRLPDIEELENPKSNLASEIYSSDGVMIGKYYIDNRTNIEFKDLSENLEIGRAHV